jgi:UDP-2-acetamido-2-deoxy-ribo-hexuluronate aminotransferase
MLPIQMVDLQRQYFRMKTEIDSAMQQVVNHSLYINGPETTQLASNLQNYLNVKHVILCANGTDALQAALMALNLQPGDEVITPTFTFIATVEVIALLGLKPVLIDVNPHTFTIDTHLIQQAITPRTKVIMPVHLFGQGANMEEIELFARQNNLFIIEDAAQCLGATYQLPNQSIKKLGTIGHIGCTSFFPSKNLGCFGDGGACFTNDDALANQLRKIVNHGAEKKYHHQIIGINSLLDTLQAAILNAKLPHLDDFNARRQWAAQQYINKLNHITQIELPTFNPLSSHIFHQFTIKVPANLRNQLSAFLQINNIPTMVYYPRSIHQQEAFANYLDRKIHYPIADTLTQQVLSLPMHTELDSDQIDHICHHIRHFFQHEVN